MHRHCAAHLHPAFAGFSVSRQQDSRMLAWPSEATSPAQRHFSVTSG